MTGSSRFTDWADGNSRHWSNSFFGSGESRALEEGNCGLATQRLVQAPVRSSVAVGMFLCAAAQLVLGASIAATRLLLDYPILAGQAVRYALAAGILAAVMLVVGVMARRDASRSATAISITRAEWAWLAALAAAGLAGYNACLVVALQHADAAVVSTIVGAVPLAVAILAPITRRHTPSMQLLTAAAIVVAGTVLVHGAGHTSPLGLAASVAALAGDVAFALVAAKLLPRLGAVRVSAYSCVLAVPMLAAASVVAGEPASWRMPNLTEGLVLAHLGVVLTAAGFWCWFRGIQLASVERGSLTVGLVPLATVVTMSVQDRALPPAAQWVGICVVVVGLLVGMSAPAAAPRTARPVPTPAARQVSVGIAPVPMPGPRPVSVGIAADTILLRAAAPVMVASGSYPVAPRV
ncbi:DMT family transporter [Micromonospora arborensis]|uniref:DMT family transporter n=1 Tax=Micromonospora arborensis TaxID=2116518 RepID=UPI0033F73876